MKKYRFMMIVSILMTLLFTNASYANSLPEEFTMNDYKNSNFIVTLKNSNNFDMEKTMISYNPIPEPIILEDGFENYINPITNEYFLIENANDRDGTVAKRFTFNIRSSVKSSAFPIKSNTLSVKSTGHYYKNNSSSSSFPVGGGRTYIIELRQGFKSKTVQFPINGTQNSTFGSGWKKGKDAYVEIINDGSFDRYSGTLKGSGYVYNN